MCGIIGYTGGRGSVDIILDGLTQLEYRGYDSAGICVESPDGHHRVRAASDGAPQRRR